MRNEVIAILLVLLVGGSLGMGYFAGNGSRPTTTTTSTVTELVPTTITTTMTTSVSINSQVCTVSADSTGFFLHLVTDSARAPIAGVQVTVIPMIECIGNPTPAISMEAIYVTNGTGWAVVSSYPGGQEYYLLYEFQYSGHGYNVTAAWSPEQGTFTTVSLPSGNVTSFYLFPKSCNGTCTY